MTRALVAAAGAVAVAGCAVDPQLWAMNPAGPQAHRIHGLWWLFVWICTAVYALVLAALAGATWRRRRASPAGPAGDGVTLVPEPAGEWRRTVTVVAAIGVTVMLLFVLLVAEFVTSRAVHGFALAPHPVTVRVIGHQWWWEVRYEDPAAANVVETANELHVPVGRPVQIQLEARDVIHSFWVPNLHGKRDMIPGHPTSITLQADREGVFQGQCAEFCGHQHAHMRLQVVAEPEPAFHAWLERQRQPAPEPTSDQQRRGRDVFVGGTCAMCHTIGGTQARGRMGPSLTHLASRSRLAAGAIPNTPGHLAGWIVDPQRVKPGVRMPQQTDLPAQDLRALVEYLGTLR